MQQRWKCITILAYNVVYTVSELSELNDDLHCNLATQQDGGTIQGTVCRGGRRSLAWHWSVTGHPVYDTNLAPFQNESLIAGWM